MQHIRSQDNWESPRPYAAGVVVGDLVFLAGHVPVDSDGATLGRDAVKQTAAVLANIGRTLQAGGLGRDAIVSTTVYLTDLNDIDGVDHAYREFFGAEGPHPTRTTVQISSLGRPEFAVEISAVGTSSAQR